MNDSIRGASPSSSHTIDQPDEVPLGYCRDDIPEMFKTGGGEFRVVTSKGGTYNTPLYLSPPKREMIDDPNSDTWKQICFEKEREIMRQAEIIQKLRNDIDGRAP
ncbi:MAG TPA: hypothetical protein VD866_00015 [Urbifossiella sp.]|nr:hypothetical protein [Urbifossiella sp.]